MMLRTAALRGVRATAVSKTPAMAPAAAASRPDWSTGVMLGSSPLSFTDYQNPLDWQEIQFLFSEKLNFIVERYLETEMGPMFFNALVLMTVLKMGIYHGFFQPSYLWHFQEAYGQTWKVGHHLYGANIVNPLKR